jgi:hypothetical protein
MASGRCCCSLPSHKILGAGKKIMFLGQKGGVPEWESHSYDLFFHPRRVSRSRLFRMTSFRLAREDPPTSSSEKPFRGVSASHEKTLRGVPPRTPSEFPPRTRTSRPRVGATCTRTLRLAREAIPSRSDSRVHFPSRTRSSSASELFLVVHGPVKNKRRERKELSRRSTGRRGMRTRARRVHWGTVAAAHSIRTATA